MAEQSRTSKSLKNIAVALLFLAVNLLLQFFCRDVFLERLGAEVLGLNTTAGNLLQFLNIAGLGPIFGAIMGVMFGPAAFLWIVLGTIFGGAVHDFLSAMIRCEGGAPRSLKS